MTQGHDTLRLPLIAFIYEPLKVLPVIPLRSCAGITLCYIVHAVCPRTSQFFALPIVKKEVSARERGSGLAQTRCRRYRCARRRRKGDHLVSVATEHKAVLDPLRKLSRRGYEITLLPVAPAADRSSAPISTIARCATSRSRWTGAGRAS